MTALVDLIVRPGIVLAAAWMVTAALRRQPASLRALVWTAAFAGLLVLPALTRVTPVWHIALWQEPLRIAPAPLTQAALFEPVAPPDSPLPERPARASVVDTAPSPITATALTPAPAFPVAALLPAVWVLVSLLLLARIALSHLRLSRLVADSAAPHQDWIALVDALRPSRGIRRAVAVRISDAVNVPAIAGVFRPVLILPADADEWDAGLRRAVVLHELAHVARWDALAQLLGQITCAVYWFNPLAWHGARRAAALRERASDDEVIRAGVPAPAYAERLLALVRGASAADRHLATVAMARPSRMRERVMAILDPVARREGVTMRKVAAVVVVSSCAVAAIAAAAPEPAESLFVKPAVLAVAAAPAQPAPPGDAAPIGPAAAVASAAAQQRSSSLCDGGSDHTHISGESNGRRTLKIRMSGSGCTIDLNATGRIVFTDDFTDISTLEGGGFFRLDVTDGGVRRQLDIESRNGSLTRTWRVDGREQPYDAGARAWFAGFLVDLDRRTAIGIDVRLPFLLRKGGVSAVLDETAHMTGDYARSAYYLGLAKAATLSTADVTRVLQQAAKSVKSDHYANEIIHAVAGRGLANDAQRAAVTELIGTMESDHYRAEAVQVLVASGRPGAAEMDFLLRMLTRMESDHYKVQVLTKVLKGATLTGEQQAMLAGAAADVESDHYATEFLKSVATTGALGTGVRQSYLESVRGIQSDHYRNEALGKLLENTSVVEGELLAMVDLGAPMGDHYESELLRRILRHRAATERVREAAVVAADRLSRPYREEVRRSAGRDR